MFDVIDQLAGIPMDDSALDQLDLTNVFENFVRNYKKLDDLKNFRSDYEQRNFLSRWWDNDKLKDAQLDSAEVQAEFSKTIGQLVAISLFQAQKINRQQQKLTEHQHTIKEQVEAGRQHTKEIERQQKIQCEQAEKIHQLVENYIAVKGISDESIRRLAAIVAKINATKEEFFAESRRVDESLSFELKNISGWARSALDQLDGRINAGNALFKNELQSLGELQAKKYQSLADDIKNLVQNQSQLEEKLNALGESSRQELEKLAEKTSSKFQSVDGTIQELETRAAAATQQARVGAERASQNLNDLTKQLKALSESSRQELERLAEKTALKFRSGDGAIQELVARSAESEKQLREDAERFKQLESDSAAILKGCIGLQKEVAVLRGCINKTNKRFWYVVCLSSVGLLTALGVLGMQMMRV